MVKWAIDLGEHEIDLKFHVSIKVQALANFITKISNNGEIYIIEENDENVK